MKFLAWLLVLAAIGATGYSLWKWRSRWLERQQAAEERFASFIAQARPATPVSDKVQVTENSSLPQQKLLFEAAAKAGEAGEPALSIQLYARLLARYPGSAFAAQARSAVEAQKERLAKAKAPDTSGRG